MALADRQDPYHGYNFRLEIDQTPVAGFRECSGLTFNSDPVEYREGTDIPLHPRKYRGLKKFSNITLKRGITQNQDLWNWFNNVLSGVADVRNGAVVLQDEQHQDVLRWEFSNGWICKWEVTGFNATSNDVTIESVDICVEQVALTLP